KWLWFQEPGCVGGTDRWQVVDLHDQPRRHVPQPAERVDLRARHESVLEHQLTSEETRTRRRRLHATASVFPWRITNVECRTCTPSTAARKCAQCGGTGFRP